MKKIFHSIMCQVSGLKIMYKLLLVYSIIGILPLTLLGCYMTYTSKNMVMNQHIDQVKAENRRVRNILFNIIYSATSISDSLLYDKELTALLEETYSSENEVYKAYRKYRTIDSIIKSYPEISGIKIFVTNKSLITSGPFVRTDYRTASRDWYKKVKDSPGKLLWVYDDISDLESSLRLIRRLPIPNSEECAIMSIHISTNYLRFIIDSDIVHSILSIDNSTVFFSNKHTEMGCSPASLYETFPIKINEPFPLRYQDKDVLASSSILNAPKSESGFQITTLDPLTYSHIQESNLMNIRIILINFAVPLLLIIGFSIVFNRRILILRREMNKIANGNLNIIENFKSQDELGELFKDMQKTLFGIQQLNTRIYEDELLKQKLINYQQQMEFNLLASQINPHFLYNTLETIRMQLSVQQESEAARIVKQLGKFMRHNLEAASSLVLLSSELEYIRIYMDIQHFRFGDRIRFQINTDPTVNPANYKILPLLIQPLVENAFIHGLEGRKNGGTVTITTSSNSSCFIISVADNGAGMNSHTLEALQGSIKSGNFKSGSHLGLHNVAQRIRLFYGENYGLGIESAETQFTVVTLYLPLRMDEPATITNGGFYHEMYHS